MISTVFTPLIVGFKITCLYVHGAGEKYSKFHLFFCVFITFLTWADIGRILTVFVVFQSGSESESLFAIFSVIVFLLMMAVSNTLHLCILTKHLPWFLSQCKEYQSMNNTFLDVIKIRTRVKQTVITISAIYFISSILAFFSSVLLPLDRNSLTAKLYYPFDSFNQYVFIPVATIINILRCAMSVGFSFTFVFYCIGCYLLYCEYKGLVEKFSELRFTCDINISDNLEQLRQQHEAITKLLSSCNGILRHYLFIIYAAGIPIICVVIYGMGKGSLQLEDMSLMVFYMIFTVLMVIAVTIIGAVVNTKAHEPRDSLFQIKLNGLPVEVLNQINIFALRLSGPPIALDVYGMFVVDKTTALTLFGTVLTYIIIVVQFLPGSNDNYNGCVCNCNSTCWPSDNNYTAVY